MKSTKIALVTGANRGLGWEITNQLTQKGYVVYAGVRNIEKSKAAFEKFVNKEAVRLVLLDMEKPASFLQAYQLIQAEAGHLDLLINNAGVMLDGDLMKDSTTSITSGTLKNTFEVNFFSVVELTNLMLPLLEKSEKANIINVSSQMGSIQLHAQKAIPARTFAYNSSKAALNAYTVHLANAIEDKGINVNAVHPGWMKTEMGGNLAPMTALEGAEIILNLIEDDSSYATGKFLHNGAEILW